MLGELFLFKRKQPFITSLTHSPLLYIVSCSGNFLRTAADTREWAKVDVRLHPGHQGPVRLRPGLRAGGREEAVVLRQRRLELARARHRGVHPGGAVQHHAGQGTWHYWGLVYVFCEIVVFKGQKRAPSYNWSLPKIVSKLKIFESFPHWVVKFIVCQQGETFALPENNKMYLWSRLSRVCQSMVYTGFLSYWSVELIETQTF